MSLYIDHTDERMITVEIDREIQDRIQEEQELQFTSFNNRTALKLGMMLVEKAEKEQQSITIDIIRSGQQLFHYACEGTTPDNDQWVLRKSRTVSRFHKSSLRVGLMLRKAGKTIEERYGVNPGEYTASGGSFPITVKNVGVVGAITVSGLTQEEDHAMVVAAIREYLGANR